MVAQDDDEGTTVRVEVRMGVRVEVRVAQDDGSWPCLPARSKVIKAASLPARRCSHVDDAHCYG